MEFLLFWKGGVLGAPFGIFQKFKKHLEVFTYLTWLPNMNMMRALEVGQNIDWKVGYRQTDRQRKWLHNPLRFAGV